MDRLEQSETLFNLLKFSFKQKIKCFRRYSGYLV